MSDPLLQVVDGPSSSAVLRYDLNDNDFDGEGYPLQAGGLDLGVPSFDGEFGGVGARYGSRRIRYTHRFSGNASFAQMKMSALSRELLREENWLKLQWSGDVAPVYFRTERGELGDLNLENAGASEVWDLSMVLTAEGLAYGERVNIPQFQIVQAPADLTAPTRYAMRYVLPAIKGDAPTALRVAITPATGQDGGPDTTWLVGCTGGQTGMSDPVIDIGTGDGCTAGVGTGAGTADAGYFNGSHRPVTISAGSNFQNRLTGPLPTVPVGRYKVLLRMEADGPTSTAKTFRCQFATYSSAFPFQYGLSVLVPVNPTASGGVKVFRGWVDLGDFSIPFGGEERAFSTLPSIPNDFAIRIGTTDSSAGDVRLDAIKLIPITGPQVSQSTLLKAKFDYYVLKSGIKGTFDGDLEMYQSEELTLLTPSRAGLSGAFPYADPASAQNLLTVMAVNHGDLHVTPSTTTLDAQSDVDVSYHPRYLYLGDGA